MNINGNERRIEMTHEKTVDYKPVRNGHWFITKTGYYDCSECGGSYYTGLESRAEAEDVLKHHPELLYSYCPHCRARMYQGVIDEK